jgi:uncharacterized protein YciI
MLLVLGISISAQKKTDVKKKPKFDAKLAKALGADEYGMRQYVLCILKTGPKDAEIKGDERTEIFKGHMANITRLANEGKIALAGPFGKNDRQYRGIFIYAVDNIADAEKLAATDPVISSGMMVAELTLWYGSAGLMKVTEISEKITEKGF